MNKTKKQMQKMIDDLERHSRMLGDDVKRLNGSVMMQTHVIEDMDTKIKKGDNVIEVFKNLSREVSDGKMTPAEAYYYNLGFMKGLTNEQTN